MASITKPILLAVIGILAVVLFLQTTNLITGMTIEQNVTKETLLGSSNVAPTVLNVSLTMATPNNGCSTDGANTICEGWIMDENGIGNITGVNATLSASGFTSTCTANNSNCYKDSDCSQGSGNATAGEYICDFGNLEWYAIPGTWTCTVTVTDGIAENDNTDTDDRDKLYALNVTDDIDWGAGTPGSILQADTDTRNCGNTIMDIEVNATTMGCTVGTILAGNITMGTSVAADELTLSGTLQLSETNHSLPHDGADDQTVPTYWNISIPTTGISGSCNGTAVFSAIEGN